MTGKKPTIITRSDGKECFDCANSGFLIESRVSFSHEWLKLHGLVSTLGGLSFMDWNNALAYCKKLVNDKKMEDKKFYQVLELIRTSHQMTIGDNIYIPNEENLYPKSLSGMGPEEYIKSYTGPRLTNGTQHISEYKAWMEANNNNTPQVLTEEQKEKKRRDLRRLKTRHSLNFLVEVPATKEQHMEEDKRIKDIEAEEKALQEAEVDKNGKRKSLSKVKQAAKKRKISSDGFRPLDFITGETSSSGLLKSLLGGDLRQMKVTVTSSITADGEPKTTLHFFESPSGVQKLRLVLPENL